VRQAWGAKMSIGPLTGVIVGSARQDPSRMGTTIWPTKDPPTGLGSRGSSLSIRPDQCATRMAEPDVAPVKRSVRGFGALSYLAY
jgi:hypothetical protein